MQSREPITAAELTTRIQKLRVERERRKTEQKEKGHRRRSLTKAQRAQILAETGGRCHICGGEISGRWNADHVLAHSGGGGHGVDNYLPAHGTCNNYRWDYLAEEFQIILKLGVFARTAIEEERPLGRDIAEAFMKKEVRRRARRVGS